MGSSFLLKKKKKMLYALVSMFVKVMTKTVKVSLGFIHPGPLLLRLCYLISKGCPYAPIRRAIATFTRSPNTRPSKPPQPTVAQTSTPHSFSTECSHCTTGLTHTHVVCTEEVWLNPGCVYGPW